jgi:hypothetical protein
MPTIFYYVQPVSLKTLQYNVLLLPTAKAKRIKCLGSKVSNLFQSFETFSKTKHLRRKKQQLAQNEITSFLRPTFLLRYFSKLHFFTNFFFGVDKLTIRDTWRQSSRRLSVSTTRSDLQVSNRSAFKLR